MPPITYHPKSPDTNIGGYRYFFNGQEGDNEVYEIGGFQNYGFRMYDTRIARFWGVDPLAAKYPWNIPMRMQGTVLPAFSN
ncbi:MAG: hypothetical protein CW341_11860 [Bacteroidetes bacterium]|nr:hypothetical protein [Bacteroidota bacterium]